MVRKIAVEYKRLRASLLRTGFFCFIFILNSVPASAQIVEEMLTFPVTVKNSYGREISQQIKVLVKRDKNNKSPILIYNHGRGSSTLSATSPNYINRCRHWQFFTDYGLAIVAPMRIGYGVSGGPDIEDNDFQRFGDKTPKVGADQILQVLEQLMKFPWVDKDRIVVLGQSVGGMVAMSLATRSSPKFQFIINFAGGQGGDPIRRPGQPTRPDRLSDFFAKFGRDNVTKTYWFYSSNDQYWGEQFPKTWFDNFISAGGRGEFVQLPPFGHDGHSILCGDIESWRSPMSRLFESYGYVSGGLNPNGDLLK